MPETPTRDDVDAVTKISGRSVGDTVARLTELVAVKGMRLFAVFDQAAEARKVGLQLRDTIMVICGATVSGGSLCWRDREGFREPSRSRPRSPAAHVAAAEDLRAARPRYRVRPDASCSLSQSAIKGRYL